MVLAPALLGKSSVKHAILQGMGGATVLEGIIGY
jgi:PII-like signaling protein